MTFNSLQALSNRHKHDDRRLNASTGKPNSQLSTVVPKTTTPYVRALGLKQWLLAGQLNSDLKVLVGNLNKSGHCMYN